MAITSLVHSATLRDIIKNVIALDFDADSMKIALFTSTLTNSIDTDPATYGVAPYNANEVTGTGWAAAPALVSPNAVLVAGTGVKLTANNISAAGTTLSSIAGCLIFDDTISPKAALVAIAFSGGPYSTINGTLAINWDALGIAQFTLH